MSFNFSAREGHVGEPLLCQLAIESEAFPGTAPITFSSVSIDFKGHLGKIKISHQASDSDSGDSASRSSMANISLQESPSPNKSTTASLFEGQTDLTFGHGQVKVLVLQLVCREAGDVTAERATVGIDTDSFGLKYSASLASSDSVPTWWLKGNAGLRKTRSSREDGTTIHILPKPPRMEIALSNIRGSYYTNEVVHIDISITNGEEEETKASI